MRPLKVKMVGFSAFRESTTVDFTGTDLVALIGPTGSGKSSIIDAITFALYGSVSRYDDLRVVEPVINQLCTEARVRLDFELGAELYTAVRVVRRTKTGATTKEARLIRVDPDGGDEVVADQAKPVSAAVSKLLGLDFDQFTRTVVLPQGQFAVFLREDKQKRQQLLRQLLDVGVYEQMGRMARSRADRTRTESRLLAEQRAAQGEVSDEEMTALVSRRDALSLLGPTVASTLARVTELDAEAVHAAVTQRSVRSELEVVRSLAVPAAVETLAGALTEAQADNDEATASLAAARTRREEAMAEAAAGPDVAATQTALDRISERDRLEGEIEGLEPQAAAAAEAEAAANRAEERSRAGRDSAEAALTAAREAAGAQSLVAALAVGEPCPVCRQTVGEIPAHDVDADLRKATAALEAARADHGARQKAASAAARQRNEVTSRLDATRAALSAVESKLDRGADPVELRSELDRAATLRAEVIAADVGLNEAEAVAAAAQRTVDELRGREAALRHDHIAARDAVAARRPPAPGGTSLAEDWAQLVTWAAGLMEPLAAEAAEAEAAERQARRALDIASVGLADACRPLGIEPGPGLTERVAASTADAGHAVVAAEQRRSNAAVLDQRIEALDDESSLTHEMGLLLSAGGFERWLLQEALDDLMARATSRLLQLSGGQFSLESTDGDLWIRDHRNADERRSVRTLSGGETFLASLALALALADNVAELARDGGPRLDSMFLDEGFGTLDPGTLDVVAAAIEELSATGRLVAIVTHIRDLADRMPVRFEVHRDTVSARVARVEV